MEGDGYRDKLMTAVRFHPIELQWHLLLVGSSAFVTCIMLIRHFSKVAPHLKWPFMSHALGQAGTCRSRPIP